MARGSINYRHVPYALATTNAQPDRNSHTVSPALQVPVLNQQYVNSPYDGPLLAISCDEGRISLPTCPYRSSSSTSDGTSPKSSRHSTSSNSTPRSSMPSPGHCYHDPRQPSQCRSTSSEHLYRTGHLGSMTFSHREFTTLDAFMRIGLLLWMRDASKLLFSAFIVRFLLLDGTHTSGQFEELVETSYLLHIGSLLPFHYKALMSDSQESMFLLLESTAILRGRVKVAGPP